MSLDQGLMNLQSERDALSALGEQYKLLKAAIEKENNIYDAVKKNTAMIGVIAELGTGLLKESYNQNPQFNFISYLNNAIIDIACEKGFDEKEFIENLDIGIQKCLGTL